jgi:hypothetical protein
MHDMDTRTCPATSATLTSPSGSAVAGQPRNQNCTKTAPYKKSPAFCSLVQFRAFPCSSFPNLLPGPPGPAKNIVYRVRRGDMVSLHMKTIPKTVRNGPILFTTMPVRPPQTGTPSMVGRDSVEQVLSPIHAPCWREAPRRLTGTPKHCPTTTRYLFPSLWSPFVLRKGSLVSSLWSPRSRPEIGWYFETRNSRYL